MPPKVPPSLSRRRFLGHLAASPLAPSLGLAASSSESSGFRSAPPAGLAFAAQTPSSLIASPADAINIFDFAPVAQHNLSAAHWAFITTGSDDNLTRDANHLAFRRFQIRPHYFTDVTRIDTSVEVLGVRLALPVMLAPVASQRAFHQDGELAIARAARAKGSHVILSCFSSYHVNDVNNEQGWPAWFQLYPTSDWDVAEQVIRRADAAGCPVLVLTADTPAGANRELSRRAGRRDSQDCSLCHAPGVQGYLSHRPTFAGIDYSRVRSLHAPITWDLIDRVRKSTSMKLVIKGIQTAEDAELCLRRGIDAIIVSNHGGRQLESLLSTIEVLPEVVQAVGAKLPVLIDSGFRRGTDVFKGLALGAKAICIGRPYLWGLGAFGQPGVERVLELLHAELTTTMRLAGTPSIDKITAAFVRRRPA